MPQADALSEILIKIGAHILWPVSCPVCGAVGELLCEECLRALFKPPLPRCLWCGGAIPCKVHPGHTPRIRAGAVYEKDMRTLVLMLKHGKYESLGFRLGRGLGNVFPRPDVDFLVPVPLHRKSKRRYNQAEALARGIGAAWNVQVKDVAFWTTDVPTRAGMRVGERLSLSEGAFGFREEVAGLRVAFVDDVCTTGSTLACLAKAAQARDAEIEGAFALAGTPGFR